ncbi:hypothetical protein YPPY16_1642, partial [Yersinia pestis PY-16]
MATPALSATRYGGH